MSGSENMEIDYSEDVSIQRTQQEWTIYELHFRKSLNIKWLDDDSAIHYGLCQ